jgi:hypothetical protein
VQRTSEHELHRVVRRQRAAGGNLAQDDAERILRIGGLVDRLCLQRLLREAAPGLREVVADNLWN